MTSRSPTSTADRRQCLFHATNRVLDTLLFNEPQKIEDDAADRAVEVDHLRPAASTSRQVTTIFSWCGDGDLTWEEGCEIYDSLRRACGRDHVPLEGQRQTAGICLIRSGLMAKKKTDDKWQESRDLEAFMRGLTNIETKALSLIRPFDVTKLQPVAVRSARHGKAQIYTYFRVVISSVGRAFIPPAWAATPIIS